MRFTEKYRTGPWMIWWVEFHVQIWKETNFKNSMLKHLIIQQYAQIFLLWRPILHYCKIKSISMSSFFFFFLLPFTQVALVGMQMLCINTALGLDLGSKGCFAFGWKQIKQLEKPVHKKLGIIHFPLVSSSIPRSHC